MFGRFFAVKKFVLILFVLMFGGGCITSAPYWIRRSVVHNDVVYVKSNNTLYRRYIPSGIRLKPNKALLEAAGSITSSNENIVVFGNYQKAKDNDYDFMEDESIHIK